jgi:hypothetical protein
VWCPPARKNRSRLLHEDERSSHWLFGGQQSGLYADEAESDLLNVTAAEPRVFVMWRLADQLARPVLLTVSYGEAARMMDADERVDGVPIPADILDQVSAFAQRYYRPPEQGRVGRFASRRMDAYARGR